MHAYIAPMLWRYCGLLLQFGIVLLVARTVDLDVAGQYFSLFGAVTVVYILSGLGIPDALVKIVPHLQATSGSDGRTLAQGLTLSSSVNLVLAAGGILVMLTMGLNTGIAILLGLWALVYAQVFLISQALVAVSAQAWGLFGAYSSVNFGYLITLVPYLSFTDSPDLIGMLFWATMGALLALAGMTGAAVANHPLRSSAKTLAGAPQSSWFEHLRALVSSGLPIAMSRLLQGMLPWLPVWFLVLIGDAEGGAIYATASRLAVVVTAILGAIRFGSRPAIVTMAARHEWAIVARMSRRASYMSAAGAVLALLFLALLGEWFVTLLLGDAYKEAYAVLIVLLIAVFAEAFGGLSDEILKMTGRAWVVLVTLAIAAGTQALLLFLFAGYGPLIAAWTTVAAFGLQYLLQVLWLRFYTPVSLWPWLLGTPHRNRTP